MTKSPKRYTITSALPYANGPLHIGHLAGAYIPADIYVRYLRAMNKDVLFVCGSDEHGAAVTLRAKIEGKTPQEIVDHYHELNKKSFENFDISFDIYHRTSAPIHYETAQDFFTKLNNDNQLDVIESEQYYDEEFEQFLADRYIIGTCPKCGNENAYGDQCENCGSTLSPTELINPRSTLSSSKPVLRKTSHWYLPMDKYENWLKEWIVEGKEDKWKSNVYGQCKSWIDGGLRPRSMTRDLDWGIPVPVEDAEGKVLYVWLDAPIGYISATKEWAKNKGEDWEKWWKDDESELIHFIGKDNIVFHCIIFPIILKAYGSYILPTHVPANEFMNLQGDKISTSRNWAIWLHEYVESFPDKKDELRYTLITNMPENKDSEFTWEDYQAKVNNELVANLGNFVRRAEVLAQKHFDGKLQLKQELNQEERAIINQLNQAQGKLSARLDKFRFREAAQIMMDLSRSGNKYLGDTEPWKLIKTDVESTERVLFVAALVAKSLGAFAEPFLPNTAQKLQEMFGTLENGWSTNFDEELNEMITISKSILLFDKIDDNWVNTQIEKLTNMSAENASLESTSVTPVKPEISYDDFAKLDIRTGIIRAAEKMPKADKLLKLTVDLGHETRNIISGIAEHFQPDEIVGKEVTVLVNLAPRKLRGEVSEGMILMAENQEKELKFISSNEIKAGMLIS